MKNRTWITFLIGAAAGAFATWLVSSDEGKKMTRKLKKELEDLVEEPDEESYTRTVTPDEHES